MAVLARGPELPLVKISVAVGALGSGVGKYFRHVARITSDVRVHAAQRVARVGVVIELGLRSQRRPARGGVAVLTGNHELAVWISGRRLPASRRRCAKRQNQTTQKL